MLNSCCHFISESVGSFLHIISTLYSHVCGAQIIIWMGCFIERSLNKMSLQKWKCGFSSSYSSGPRHRWPLCQCRWSLTPKWILMIIEICYKQNKKSRWSSTPTWISMSMMSEPSVFCMRCRWEELVLRSWANEQNRFWKWNYWNGNDGSIDLRWRILARPSW